MRFLRYLLPCFLLVSSAFAALPAAMVWECRVGNANGGASQNNGGGFLSGTSATPVDYSIQDANHFTSTAFKMTAADRSKVWNSSGTAFDTADVNNVLHITAWTGGTLGWYQVTAVDGNSTATLDRVVAGSYTANSGTGCLGGAFKIGGTLDDDFFEAKAAGNKIWIAAGSYTTGEGISVTTGVGTDLLPVVYEGYLASRGDVPTLNNRPLITAGAAYSLTWPRWGNLFHLRFATTGNNQALNTGQNGLAFNCKGSNTSNGWGGSGGGNSRLISCEFTSRQSVGVRITNDTILDCYIHDCDTGVMIADNGGGISNSVIDTCDDGLDVTYYNGQDVINNVIRNCRFGITSTSGAADMFINNIIADCVTGASWSTGNERSNFWDYNCWSNNGTDVTNVTKGSHDVTADALLVSGTAKGTDGVTSASGLVFTAASNPFGSVTTSDCLNIVETGTGATLGVYVISSVDGAGQITLATSALASKSNIDYCIVLGSDFTLSSGSPCFNAGLKLGSDVGL